MKRDMALIRKILEATEAHETNERISEYAFDGFDQEVIRAHVVLLIKRGLLDGTLQTAYPTSKAVVAGLTWEGHDFLAESIYSAN